MENNSDLVVLDEKTSIVDNNKKGKIVKSSGMVDFDRVDFKNPMSILSYGNEVLESISQLLINIAQTSISDGSRFILTDDMINRISSFGEELDKENKSASKKKNALALAVKKGLAKIGLGSKDHNLSEKVGYQAKYEEYCDNIKAVCGYVEQCKQDSLKDIQLRRDIQDAMMPYLEKLNRVIIVGIEDLKVFLKEIELAKEDPNADQYEVSKMERLASLFNDKIDKLQKAYTSYRQQLQTYEIQQENEMSLVLQHESYLKDQQPILYSQGSSMIFNSEQQHRARNMEKLNEGTNKAYETNAQQILSNTNQISNLMVNGGLRVESIQKLHDAISQGITILRESRTKLNERIENDRIVVEQILEDGKQYEAELGRINDVIDGLTNGQSVPKLRRK